ncbi:hypothetical protein K474DRAFT_1645833 [Panus rudis PR-1116 ss-1]|nr:hypothetical protein K474DRAFT_1645833 [Panus rudis PR-1116 ss-1]
MAKGKSSASTATRKKHARKAAAARGEAEEIAFPKEKKPKKEKGLKKGKEARKKVYIPPTKPAPVQPDPLDTLGIAQRIPPELHVVLRRLAKKDSTTKRRALEELQSDWVEKARAAGPDSPIVQALVESIPVWLHHVPSLFIHPSRRIRLLAVGLHASLLESPSQISEQLLFFLQEIADPDQAEYLLGTWRMAAHDIDRQVSLYARQAWDQFINVQISTAPADTSVEHTASDETLIESAKKMKLVLDDASFTRISTFLQRVLLDPGGVYLNVNPPQPAAPPPPPTKKGGSKSASKAGTPVRRDSEQVIRAKPEEDEESEGDRNARLRIGAFGAAEWALSTHATIVTDPEKVKEYLALFDNAALWTALYHGRHAPYLSEIEAFGWNQPNVRKATWSFLQILIRTRKEHLQSLLPTLSSAVLRSAWVEPDSGVRNVMWPALLTFLKEYPNAWELEATPHVDEEDEEDDSDNDEGSQPESKPQPITPHITTPIPQSQAYQEFLQFLELGCSGSPIQGYPAVLIILSTIPPSIFATSTPPLQVLFTSFWAAVDGRALSGLDRATASAAFLSSLVECAMFMVKRLRVEQFASVLAGKDDPVCVARSLLSEQVARVWEEVSSGRLKVEVEMMAKALARTLKVLDANDQELFDAVWKQISTAIQAQLKSTDSSSSSLVPTTLRIFQLEFEPESRAAEATKRLVAEVVQAVVDQFDDILKDENVQPEPARLTSLISILNAFGSELFADEETAKDIDNTMLQNTSRVLNLSPGLILVYLTSRNSSDQTRQVWHAVLRAVSADPTRIVETLSPLLDAAEKGTLPSHLGPEGDELDSVVTQMLANNLTNEQNSRQDEIEVVCRILKMPGVFISTDTSRGLLSSIGQTLSTQIQSIVHDDNIPLAPVATPVQILQTALDSPTADHFLSMAVSLLPDLFLLAFVVPAYRDMPSSQRDTAVTLWEVWFEKLPEDVRTDVVAVVQHNLRDLLSDTSASIRPLALLQVVRQHESVLGSDLLSSIFPQEKELDAMLDSLPNAPMDSSLAVIDPLVPMADEESDEPESSVLDRWGYSTYARIVIALLHYLAEERQAAKEHAWSLKHFVSLWLYADEVLQLPHMTGSVFGKEVPQTELKELSSKTQQLTAYVLSAVVDEQWLSSVIAAISEGKTPSDAVGRLLQELIKDPMERDTVNNARILHILLQHALANATKEHADQLLLLGRKIEAKAPRAALAIVYSVTRYAPEPPRLDRYRNELAAALLGIPPSKANAEGLWTLRRLSAVAPDPDSDVVFLPTPRAVNVMKACQQWVSSDEDINEAVESEMTQVFTHLAPILQNVPGAHWDFILDVMENNLENCSFDETASLPTLARTLKLLLTVQDLAGTNKSLRAVWQERQTAILTLVRDLVQAKSVKDVSSGPLSVCRELAMSIVQDLPASLIDHDTFPKMCHLVTDSSPSEQTMAYSILKEAAHKRTEHLVVEAAVETDNEVKPELPLELVDILQRSLPLEDDPDESPVSAAPFMIIVLVIEMRYMNQLVFGNLLSWMLVFDLFTNASLKVKSGYIEHLRSLNLISDYFLPEVLNILGLYGGMPKAFKLDIWAVDEFYLDLYVADSPISLRLLAAHLYYRALMIVPSLFRSWLLDCRDRQLSAAVTTYTSTFFSPTLIRSELAQVKNPELAADLSDENLKIKVSNAVNEITASYTVDEYQLELRLKLPADWPLHSIEVKDTNRIGVTEDRWRAWILGVQQILTFRSGSIVDGLSFFKKNVTSHFEGQSECAICYSVISAMDGSLPKKPCKTCKNKFHAGCLYKWFNTSHSPTCPLCRSEIM